MVSFKQGTDDPFGFNVVGVASSPDFAASVTNPFGLSNVAALYSTPTFADIDGDGDLDAFIGEEGNGNDANTLFFRNTGNASSPSFATPVTNPFGLSEVPYFSRPTFADIDSDGDLDAFIGNGNGDILFFQNTSSSRSPSFSAPVTNPFGLSDVSPVSSPTFADIDSDGDLDAFLGGYNGNTFFFQNTGSASSPSFAAPSTNPFGLSDVGNLSTPTFADIEEDGDLDAFIGVENGDTNFFQNTGSSTSPKFAAPQANPFGLSAVNYASTPTFADIEGDGDLDAFIGDEPGDTNFFQNTSSSSSPKFAAAVTNPFGLSNVGDDSAPTFADIDSDGDLDAFIGGEGNTSLFQNTGSANSPNFATPVTNPFGLSNAGSASNPTFADIDSDGDLDAFIGDEIGITLFFQNTGSASSPNFAIPVDNAFGLNSTTREFITPTFADTDSDGDLDAFIGGDIGDTLFFQNTGSSTNPNFAAAVTNPFGLSDVGQFSAPTFADIDSDGDLDALIGDEIGDTLFFQNTGSSTNPNFAAAVTNPFGLSDVVQYSKPTFADIDSDGDLDAFIGDGNGDTFFFLNTPSLSGAGGQQQFTIAAGDGTVNISNFGGVSQGTNPAAAVVAEVDTVQFTGANLTPEKLLLTQQGDNLELSFEGVADTKVVLGNFTLEELDNLTQATSAAVDLGNILFAGQSVVEDSFDVFDADSQRQQVFNRNSITFLNDLDNTIKGFNRSDDVINGQGGNDYIRGRSGDDLLRGGDGRDKLTGGKGDDILVGGEDDDLLNGGRGEDLFVLAANADTDTVQDFKNGSDRFGLAAGLTFGQLSITQSGSNTLISVSATNEVLASLMGVNANLIGAEDFTTEPWMNA